MITFKTVEAAGPLRVVQVGAGGMGKAWIQTLQVNCDVEPVALVDLNLGAAQAAVEELGCLSRAVPLCRRWRLRRR